VQSFSIKFFAGEELEKLEALKLDLRKGSKMGFVLSLVSHVVKNEKVLIFFHNLCTSEVKGFSMAKW
jgi:hypothetical protein